MSALAVITMLGLVAVALIGLTAVPVTLVVAVEVVALALCLRRVRTIGLEFTPGQVRLVGFLTSETYSLDAIEDFDLVFTRQTNRVYLRRTEGAMLEVPTMSFSVNQVFKSTPRLRFADAEKTDDVLGRLRGQLAWQREHASRSGPSAR